MFKQKKENEEIKNKNEGFVDDKGNSLDNSNEKQKDEVNPNDVDLSIKNNIEYKNDYFKTIDKKRKEFNKVVKKQNWIKWAVSFVSIGLLVFAFIYVMNVLKIRWLGIVLIVVSILIIIGYYFIIKAYNKKLMDAYLKDYYGNVNAYAFGEGGFKEVNGDINGKIDNEEFNKSLLYKEVSQIGSRNIVKFKVGDAECKICDCAAQKTTVKKLVPLFIGKYLISTNKCDIEEPIFIYLTGNSRALPPNNLDELPKVFNSKKMIIYSKNPNYEKIVNAKVRQLISTIVTNNVLVDCSIAIHKGNTYFGLGYDDCLMVLPLQDTFNPVPTERFAKDLLIIAEIIKNLN